MTKKRSSRLPKVAATRANAANHRRGSTGALFPIVGIGASAGGLEAFTQLLKQLPLNTGMAFVLVQHLDPLHESALVQILSRATRMPVHEALNNQRVEPDRVYIIPPNTSLGITRGVLKLLPRQQARTPHHSINIFFEALAQDRRERAIGVILSGTATDGTLGLEAIRAEGGITFAQDDSARYDSMPRSAIAEGCVDFVLSPQGIAQELARIARHPYVGGKNVADGTDPELHRIPALRGSVPLSPDGRGATRNGVHKAGARDAMPGDGGAEAGFKKILTLLRNHSGVDFSLYKSTTIQRRITRRVMLIKGNTFEAYAEFLRGNAKELDALYSDVLISVTSFFRNSDAFDILKSKVFSKLQQQRGNEPFRVWTLGCSTGQEAYSIAMAYAEATADALQARKLQIFATDLNEALLEKARSGLYAKSLVADVSPERLRRFFVEEEGGYRIVKSLREMVVFARQNLIGDPPFSRMDLISCRNLLIYLEPALQQKALPTFHYALKPGGFLFLGASESTGNFPELFAPADKKHKIYLKKATSTAAAHLPIKKQRMEPHTAGRSGPLGVLAAVRGARPEGLHPELSAQREADRVAVNRFAPPSVLINAEMQILQFRGPTGSYLEPPTGKASFDVLKMAREGLMRPLRTAIKNAIKEGKTTYAQNIRMQQNGKARAVNVEVIPLKNLREPCFLVAFEDAQKPVRKGGRMPSAEAAAAVARLERPRLSAKQESRRIAELEADLGETRDYMQSIQEQYEAANEELQASSEEVQSANEELQSVNEELETSKEELESANEELTTVNEEMTTRNAELNRLNGDLLNLQNSARLSIVVLNRDLTLRRFSAQAARQLDLAPSDIGRPIGHVRHPLLLANDLEGFIAGVIADVQEREREARDPHGHWYAVRVRPYFTLDNKVDGAVLVLVDIDALKHNEQAIVAARDYAESIIQTTRDPLLILDSDLRVHRANQAFYTTFRISPAQAQNRLIYELDDRQWDIPRLRELLEEILPRDSAFDHFEITHKFGSFGPRTLLLNARRLKDERGGPGEILLGIEDVTERRQAETALNQRNAQFEILFNQAPVGVYLIGPDFRVRQANPIARLAAGDIPGLIGRDLEEVLRILWAKPYADGAIEHFRHTLETGESYVDPQWIVERLDRGVIEYYEWQIHRLPLPEGRYGVVCYFRDISDEARARAEGQEVDSRKNEFLAMLAHELRNPLAPLGYMLEILKRADGRSERIAPALETMERQLAQMTRLIDDLLDVSRISRGEIQLHPQQVELGSVIQQVVDDARPAMESNRHQLKVTLPQQPLVLHADAVRLSQTIGNLLNNACKFTNPGGHITLTVERRGSDAVITVRDSGIGIPAALLPKIFEMFTQGDQTLERAHGGLGIGLALVQRLVQMHHGSVSASSEGPGRGSEFVVRLPLVDRSSASLPAAIAAGDPAALPACRILVVDDNRASATAMAMLLKQGGHQSHTAFDGLEALEAAASLRPDIVLLDLGLPKLNGYDVARRIREQPWGQEMVLVALTGWGQDEHRKKSTEAGFDGHLVKPVRYTELTRLLARLIMNRGGAGRGNSG